MQFTRDIPEDDEQHFPRATSQRSTGKLHGQFHNTGQNHEGTGRKNSQVLKDSRETQFVFQEVKMQLQHGRNPYLRSHHRERTSQDGTREDKDSKEMEDTSKGQRCGKLPWVCKLLSVIYPKFQPITKPLNELKDKKDWKWEEEHQKVLEELKEKITSQLVLLLPRREGKFRVEIDVSGHAIEGVLSQEQDRKWKPIAFLSRTMQPAEKNYRIYNKKLLAIVEALTKWR